MLKLIRCRKAVPKGKFIVINVYIRRKKRPQIDNPISRDQINEEQTKKSKVSRKNNKYQNRNKINRNRKKIQKNNKVRLFFEKINKTDKPLVRLTKEKRKEDSNKCKYKSKRMHYNYISHTEIQQNIRYYYEQLGTNKLDNLEKKDKFLEAYYLPRLNDEEKNLNRVITRINYNPFQVKKIN